MSFCNVRELLNVGFEIRTQNSTPMAIIPSEDINRKSHLYHKLDYWYICNLQANSYIAQLYSNFSELLLYVKLNVVHKNLNDDPTNWCY